MEQAYRLKIFKDDNTWEVIAHEYEVKPTGILYARAGDTHHYFNNFDHVRISRYEYTK